MPVEELARHQTGPSGETQTELLDKHHGMRKTLKIVGVRYRDVFGARVGLRRHRYNERNEMPDKAPRILTEHS